MERKRTRKIKGGGELSEEWQVVCLYLYLRKKLFRLDTDCDKIVVSLLCWT